MYYTTFLSIFLQELNLFFTKLVNLFITSIVSCVKYNFCNHLLGILDNPLTKPDKLPATAPAELGSPLDEIAKDTQSLKLFSYFAYAIQAFQKQSSRLCY